MLTRKGAKRGASLKQRLLDLMIKEGPLSALGAQRLTEGDIERRAASAALRDGVKLGVFEHFPGAPKAYRPTRRALEQLAQTTAQE